jgi:hypothetical protein
MAGSCEHGDEHSGSGCTESVSFLNNALFRFHIDVIVILLKHFWYAIILLSNCRDSLNSKWIHQPSTQQLTLLIMYFIINKVNICVDVWCIQFELIDTKQDAVN